LLGHTWRLRKPVIVHECETRPEHMTDLKDLFTLVPELPWPRIAAGSIQDQIQKVRRKAERARQHARRSITQLRKTSRRAQAPWTSSDARDVASRIARMNALIDALPASTAELRETADQLRQDLQVVTSFLKRSR
jgi:alkylated DNA repair dioxygenase AlkB